MSGYDDEVGAALGGEGGHRRFVVPAPRDLGFELWAMPAVFHQRRRQRVQFERPQTARDALALFLGKVLVLIRRGVPAGEQNGDARAGRSCQLRGPIHADRRVLARPYCDQDVPDCAHRVRERQLRRHGVTGWLRRPTGFDVPGAC
ncbi:MAG: hypothetical protein R3E86_20650 [Pseudomonadales bacterium]